MKRSVVLAVVVLLGAFFVKPVVAQTPEEVAKMPKYGNVDSVECITQLSLYSEFFKQWKQSKYKGDAVYDALNSWRWVFKNGPKSSENIYVNGAKMFNYLIKKTKNDKQLKEKYIDTLMMIYDQRMKYFSTKKGVSQVGKIKEYKGADLFKQRPEAYGEVYVILGEALKERKTKARTASIVYYIRSAKLKYEKEEIEFIQLFDNYDFAMEIIQANIDKYELEANSKKEERWINVKNTVDKAIEQYATCDVLVPNYQKKFLQEPDNVELMRKMLKVMDKKGCDEGYDFFWEVAQRLDELEPTPESKMQIGRKYIMDEDYTTAVKYITEALPLLTEKDKIESANYYLASIYTSMKQYPKARKYAREAIKINPKNGNAYILIGDMYAGSAKDCGSNDLTKLVAYWAAVDKYKKAKSVDPEVAERANKKIAKFSQYFPTMETIFFHTLQEGDTYEVGCWINETTTVRAKK